MKKVFSLAICTIALISCNKKQLNTVSPESSSTVVAEAPLTNQRIGNPGDYTTYYDHGGTDYGCGGNPANCYGASAIANPDVAVFDEFFVALNNCNQDIIKTKITNNILVLAKYIDKADLEFVLSGVFKIRVKGSEANANRYIVFTNAQTAGIEMVYSIKPY